MYPLSIKSTISTENTVVYIRTCICACIWVEMVDRWKKTDSRVGNLLNSKKYILFYGMDIYASMPFVILMLKPDSRTDTVR